MFLLLTWGLTVEVIKPLRMWPVARSQALPNLSQKSLGMRLADYANQVKGLFSS